MQAADSPPAPRFLPARQVIATAWNLVTSRPREVMGPVAVVQVPAAIAAAAITAGMLLTVFANEPLNATRGGQLALALMVSAGEALFAQVARGAAIVSIAGVLQGRPVSLTGALDPAFTRMGGLFALALIVTAGVAVAAVSIVGLLVLPYLAIRFALAFEAFMLEERGALPALGRSWTMMRGHMLRMLGVIALTLLIVIGPLAMLSLLGGAVGGSRTTQVLAEAGVSVAQGILLVPLVAFVTATTTVFYLNLRDAEHG